MLGVSAVQGKVPIKLPKGREATAEISFDVVAGDVVIKFHNYDFVEALTHQLVNGAELEYLDLNYAYAPAKAKETDV